MLVFSVKVTVTVPLLLPEAGLTVTQLRDSVTVQSMFEVTEKVWLCAAFPTLMEVGETARNAAPPQFLVVYIVFREAISPVLSVERCPMTVPAGAGGLFTWIVGLPFLEK